MFNFVICLLAFYFKAILDLVHSALLKPHTWCHPFLLPPPLPFRPLPVSLLNLLLHIRHVQHVTMFCMQAAKATANINFMVELFCI